MSGDRDVDWGGGQSTVRHGERGMVSEPRRAGHGEAQLCKARQGEAQRGRARHGETRGGTAQHQRTSEGHMEAGREAGTWPGSVAERARA